MTKKCINNFVVLGVVFSLTILLFSFQLTSSNIDSNAMNFISAVYAQQKSISLVMDNDRTTLEPPGNVSDSTNNKQDKDIVLNTTTTDIPVLEKLSDNGAYKIQIRWGQPPSLLSQRGFDMEIVFLNATAPPSNA